MERQRPTPFQSATRHPSPNQKRRHPSRFQSDLLLRFPFLQIYFSEHRGLYLLLPGEIRGLIASLRRFRKSRRRQTARKQPPPKEKELELNVKVCVEKGMPDDPEVLSLVKEP